MVEFRNKVTF
jgi:hypothetical protein